MLVKRTREWTPYFHLCLYGRGGSGKTKAAADFHNAGHPLVVVADYNYDMTLDLYGVECPVITPRNENELRAIVEQPQMVIEKVIQPNGWEGYQPKTFLFDIFKDLQGVILGNPQRKPTDVFDGAMQLEEQKRSGLLQNSSDEKPEFKEWFILDTRARSIMRSIGKMPYHTIVTFHSVEGYDTATKLKLTGDERKDKEVPREVEGSINVMGDKIKYDLGYLASDFFIYLGSNGSQYTMYPKPAQGYFARTRMAAMLPPQIDWKDKNMYQLLWSKYEDAKKKGGVK